MALVGRWLLDEVSGAFVDSVYGQNGTLNGPTDGHTVTRDGTRVCFNPATTGVSSSFGRGDITVNYLNEANNPRDLDFELREAFSVAFYLRWDGEINFLGTYPQQGVLGNRVISGGAGGWWVRIDGPSLKPPNPRDPPPRLSFVRWVDATVAAESLQHRVLDTVNVPVDTEIHVLCTYDGTTSSIWVDGSFRASSDDTRNMVVPASVHTLRMGMTNDGGFIGDVPYYLKGCLRDVRIWAPNVPPEEVFAPAATGEVWLDGLRFQYDSEE